MMMIRLLVRESGISDRSRITSGSRSVLIYTYIPAYQALHIYIAATAPALTVSRRERERNRVTRNTKIINNTIIIQKRHTHTRAQARTI